MLLVWVEIRDAEWVIKRADLISNGTHSLLVTGIPELLRGREARFLPEIDEIRPLSPEDADLAPDTSPCFAAATRLPRTPSTAGVNARRLPAHRVGRLWKFKLSELDEWVRASGAEELQWETRDRHSEHE